MQKSVDADGDGGGSATVVKFAYDSKGNAYSSFGFRVQDNGGTENGGIDLDPTTRIMTIDINQGL